MKAYIALAIVALLNSQSEVNAVQLKSQVAFVDDIVKALAEAEKADEKAPAESKKETKPEPPKEKPAEPAKKDDKQKKDDKKTDDEVPMDSAAIKAYSSVIADAAEDSEPSTPVIYTEVKDEARADSRLSHAP